MVDATALFAALRWSTYQQGDCAEALIALIDSLKIEANSPAAFDVLDRLTTTSIMSTVRRNKDPDNNAITGIETHTVVNLKMPNEAALNARRKAMVKPPLQITDLSHCTYCSDPQARTVARLQLRHPHAPTGQQRANPL